MAFDGFPPATLQFLGELQDNNNREWFQTHKSRYEHDVLAPSLAFIEAMEKPLGKVAPLLRAEAKRVGGSLMRIYKDTRFSKDKTPYKTNIGIQFRHSAGKDVHAPCSYLHIAPDEIFYGVGVWRPDSAALRAIREFIDTEPTAWKRGFHNKKFRSSFEIFEDRLKKAPRGYAPDHPMVEDLKLKSFLGSQNLSRAQIARGDLVKTVTELTRTARPMMQILCEAVGQPF